MSISVVESDRFELMEKVADLTMKGTGPGIIAKQLGITRVEVKNLQQDYRDALSNDQEARDMARDYLNMMVKHYDGLIAKFYDLLDDMDTLDWNAAAAAQKSGALKAIADLDAKRVDALQKAGLLDSAELGDELAKFEEEKAMVLSVLTDLCTVCSPKVADRINRLQGKIMEPVEVFDE